MFMPSRSFSYLTEQLLILSLCLPLTIGWWPFDGGSNEPESSSKEKQPEGLVPFEVMSVEQKFLQEAKELLNLSPLDSCQHKVVDSLRHSCGKLSEEEIAKLSVQLLNCQSQSEGREVFTCSQDMSIADCTRPMDAHTWNAYHIISNRARSVCFTIRQAQFRMQAETAVNRLSQSTLHQLKAMEDLATSQDEIRQSTLDSLDVLKKEKDELSKRQSDLKSYQEELRSSMKENIDHLAEERSFIATGQTLIHNMTKSIEEQLRVSQETLKQQEANRTKQQEFLSQELNKMSRDIKEVWSVIDNSTLDLLTVVNQLNQQYADMQKRLTIINNTISHVLSLLDDMNGVFGAQLGWLMDTMGGAQDGLYNLTSIASHGVFLLVSCLVLLFLKAPWLSRLTLLIIVVLNLAVDVNTDSTGLSLVQLTVLMGIILIGDFVFLSYRQQTFKHMHYSAMHPIVQSPISPGSHCDSTNSSRHTVDISDDEIDEMLGVPPIDHTHVKKHVTPPPLSFSTPGVEDFASSVSSTSRNNSVRCTSFTRSGLPCRLSAIPGSQYCFRHKQ